MEIAHSLRELPFAFESCPEPLGVALSFWKLPLAFGSGPWPSGVALGHAKWQCSANTFFTQVVPFSPASGLLEWVEDTIPVHEYLTGKDRQAGAHRRYSKPGEMTFTHCLQAMHKAKPGQLRQTFDDVSTCILLLQMSLSHGAQPQLSHCSLYVGTSCQIVCALCGAVRA